MSIRKIGYVILILVLSVSVITGCGDKKAETVTTKSKVVEVPEGPGPTSTDPKATAEKVLKMIEKKDWTNLYGYIYVDIQKTISKEDFIKYNSRSKVKYKNHQVGEPQLKNEWVDKIGGTSYKNVMEVPYTVDVVTPRGEIKFNNNMYLIQTPEKNWRYLWIKK